MDALSERPIAAALSREVLRAVAAACAAASSELEGEVKVRRGRVSLEGSGRYCCEHPYLCDATLQQDSLKKLEQLCVSFRHTPCDALWHPRVGKTSKADSTQRSCGDTSDSTRTRSPLCLAFRVFVIRVRLSVMRGTFKSLHEIVAGPVRRPRSASRRRSDRAVRERNWDRANSGRARAVCVSSTPRLPRPGMRCPLPSSSRERRRNPACRSLAPDPRVPGLLSGAMPDAVSGSITDTRGAPGDDRALGNRGDSRCRRRPRFCRGMPRLGRVRWRALRGGCE